jgi:pyridoxine 4-dehydrogenase
VEVLGQKLLPYCGQLGTKVSVRRGEDGSWIPAFSGEGLTAAVHDNLRNLGLDVLDVVNLRSMFSIHDPPRGRSRHRSHSRESSGFDASDSP